MRILGVKLVCQIQSHLQGKRSNHILFETSGAAMLRFSVFKTSYLSSSVLCLGAFEGFSTKATSKLAALAFACLNSTKVGNSFLLIVIASIASHS
jgi:hypothetical protein